MSETLKKLTISTSDAGDNGVYAVVYETMRNGSPTAGRFLTSKFLSLLLMFTPCCYVVVKLKYGGWV